MSKALSLHDALVYVMVMVSAVDRQMADVELSRIGGLTKVLPVFEGFDEDRILGVAQECQAMLEGPEGLDITLELIKEAVPPRLRDTAFAIAMEIASADLKMRDEEARLLELLRVRLGLDKLTAVAIETAARARLRRA